ncbi:MAG: hypothetical protein GY861_19395 [bacterium]|nr:hypothetical protein [bacterium]
MKEEELKKERRRYRQRKIIAIIILIIVIHIILNLIKIPQTTEEIFLENVSYEVFEERTGIEPVSVDECEDKQYLWGYEWVGWLPEHENKISPRFRLTNIEEKIGEYTVYFAFFDESEYLYENYKGQYYDDVRERLPWSSASMYSEKVKVTLGVGEKALITIYTEKKDPNAVYWVYPDINVPVYPVCSKKLEYQNVTTNKSVTKYKIEPIKRNATERITLWDLLMSKLF